MTAYPASFFVAHRLFSGPAFQKGPVWGDVLDGPETDDDRVISIIGEVAWGEDIPTRDTLRVWHIRPGMPAEDVTDWAVWRVGIYMRGEEYA
jgi:hypothetical protein